MLTFALFNQTRTAQLIRSVVAASLLSLALAAPTAPYTPVHAADTRPPDYDARLEIILHSITVLDSLDFLSDGEFEFRIGFELVRPPCLNYDEFKTLCYQLAGVEAIKFSAGKHDVVHPEAHLPGPSAMYAPSYQMTEGTGLGVRKGETYRLFIAGTEVDPGTFADEDAGIIIRDLSYENNWGIGVHTERALRGASYRGTGNPRPGPTEIKYEIRRMPLPNLRGTEIRVLRATSPGGADSVCLPVQNAGSANAAPFSVTFRLSSTLAIYETERRWQGSLTSHPTVRKG